MADRGLRFPRFRALASRAVALRARALPVLAFLRAAVRWDAWYSSKVPVFLGAMYYAALTGPLPPAATAGTMAALFVVLVLYAAYGHAINDLSDRRVDLAAGKRNMMATLPDRTAKLFAGGLGVLCFLAALPAFHDDAATMAAVVACVAGATAYSLPPVRFKERGIFGVVVAALAQRTLPLIAIFTAMDAWTPSAILLCVWSMITGLRYIIAHQVSDLAADIRAGVKTVATRVGRPLLWTILLLVVIPLEGLLLAATVYLVPPDLMIVQAFGLAYGTFVYFQMILAKHKLLPAPPSQHTILLVSSCVWWPLALALTLAARDPLFCVLVALTIAWLWKPLERQWRDVVATTSAVRTAFTPRPRRSAAAPGGANRPPQRLDTQRRADRRAAPDR